MSHFNKPDSNSLNILILKSENCKLQSFRIKVNGIASIEPLCFLAVDSALVIENYVF